MAAMEGVTSSGADNKYGVPIETVYVKNLNEYVKLETLKETLNAIFKHYGNIIDIEAKASLKRRGQAFIVYDAEQSAYDAALEMDGFELYGKTMKVDMAKTHSDKTLQLKATEDQFEQHKRERLTAKERKLAEEAARQQAQPTLTTEKRSTQVVPDQYVRPNKTLVLQNLPADVDAEVLSAIFDKFEGFVEARAFAARAIGFAEFENEQFAITAKEATANMPVGEDRKPMKVTYQRQDLWQPEHGELPR